MSGYLFLLLIVATHASLFLLVPYSIRRLWLVVALYSTGTLIAMVLLLHPSNQWLVANRHQVHCESGRPCVGLTFDDGPNEDTTPRVLDILRDKGVKATFFLVGREAERLPDLVRRLSDEGHAIGNHTYSHPLLFSATEFRRFVFEPV